MRKKTRSRSRTRKGTSILEQAERNLPPRGYTEQQLRAAGPVLAKTLRKINKRAKAKEEELALQEILDMGRPVRHELNLGKVLGRILRRPRIKALA